MPSLSSSDRPALNPWFDEPPCRPPPRDDSWLSRFAASFDDLAAGVAAVISNSCALAKKWPSGLS